MSFMGARKAYERIRKQCQRTKRGECIGPKLRQKVAALAILGAPWDCIRATVVKMGRISGRHVVPAAELSDAFLQDVIRRALVKDKVSADVVTDPASSLHLAATRLWYEWCCAMWVVRQNMKGVSVPSKLLLKHYYQLWPMGPHAESVQHHLDQMKNMNTKKRWLTRFRRSWGFSYSKLPAAAPMTKEQIDSKVDTVDLDGKSWLHFFEATLWNKGARIGTVFEPKTVPTSDAVRPPYYKSYIKDQTARFSGPFLVPNLVHKKNTLSFTNHCSMMSKSGPRLNHKLAQN